MSEHEAATHAQLLAIANQHNAIVVDFYATWCGPCVNIAPYVHQQCQSNGVTLVKVNVDVNTESSQKYGIQAMPTFKVIDRQGNELLSKVGGSQAVVNEIVAKAASYK
jgi:thioredoxin 1